MATPVTLSFFAQGSVTPSNINYNFGSPYTLGFRFSSLIDGWLLGFKFYKGSSDTGVHSGSLWNESGVLLTIARFEDEGASGWQSCSLTTPYPIIAGTVYRASYYMPSGVGSYGSILNNGYTSGSVYGPFTNPISMPAGNCGCYNGGVSYPSNVANNWYGNDIIFGFVVPDFTMSVNTKTGTQAVVGACRGINMGGPTSYLGDGTFGRHLQIGVTKSLDEGNPSPPSLKLEIPGMWRFRWSVKSGTRRITVSTMQNSTGSYRPSVIVKANPEIGLYNDISGSAADISGWTTIGPVSFTSIVAGAVWVELWNNNNQMFNSPAYFDHIITT
jgi:hypothetical protein